LGTAIAQQQCEKINEIEQKIPGLLPSPAKLKKYPSLSLQHFFQALSNITE